MGSILQSLFGLAIVLGAIAGCAWLARRAGVARATGRLPLSIVGALPLGARERLVVVEVQGQWLVLGIAPGRVSSIATLPRGELSSIEPVAPQGPAFAALLDKIRRAPR